MSMRRRCHICDGIAVDHCSVCGRPACSLCMVDDVCRRCMMVYDEHGTGKADDDGDGGRFRIGYAALRDVADMPMLIVGVSILIIGMLLISYASMSMVDVPNQGSGTGDDVGGRGGDGGGGIVVVFPFPFVILVPDTGMMVLIMLLVVLVPLILFLLIIRRGLRVP
ncbi:MAG: hypothetical protein NZ888_05435 [Candidatus Nitrosocaldus sp.]|nr:hypothetical protein [Candidatus Nitrosocaldus sp.]MDW8000574.1 hypothetical protein [Candidatus Nitrosocaldus sp.]